MTRVNEQRYPYAAADLDEVRKHIRKLLDVHHSHRTICRATGIPYETLRHVLYRNRSVTKNTRDLILGVELRPPWETPGFILESNDRIPAIGSVRRLQALSYMGYPVSRVAKETGGCAVHLRELSPQGMILVRTAERIRKFYRVALAVSAPVGRVSDLARHRAIRNGWPGPGAWDDIDRDVAPDTEGSLGVVIEFVKDWPGLTASNLQQKIRSELGMQGTTAGKLIKEALDLGEIERIRDHRSVRVYAREETLHA
jgi:hypothetical protein